MQEPVNLPKCGIVVATFNNAEWLLGAIQSAVNSDYPSKVVYVVSDASTDNTDEVMASIPEITTPKLILQTEYIAKVARKTAWHQLNGVDVLYIVLKENHGPSFARNLAIQNAIHMNKCHIIANLDSDDQIMPQKLSRCISTIMSDPQTIGGVYADYIIYDMTNDQMTYHSKYSYCIFKHKQESIVHSGAVYSSLALEYVRQQYGFYYNPQLTTCEDYFLHRAIASRYLFIGLAEALTLVRAHNNSSVNYRSKETWENNYRIAMSVPL